MNNLTSEASFRGFVAAILPLFLLLLSCGSLRAGRVEHNNYVDYQDLAVNNVYSLHDPTWMDEAQNPSGYAASRENQVRLVYSRDGLTDIDGHDWKLQVKYTVFFIGQNLAPVTDVLTIEHSPGAHQYEAVKVYRPGAYKFRVRIDGITPLGTTPIPSDVRLELATVTERYGQLDITSPPTLAYDAPSGTLHWSYVPGAESYDVEWAWVDDMNMATVVDPFEKAVRVNVSNHYVQPHLTYREGVMHFRVRAVGRFIDGVGTDYSHRRYGNWSDEDTYTIPDGWEEDWNLSYTTTYAEDGKFKKVMSYVDGAGKVRQTLTHLNSDSTTVVTQTEFDHEGRGVITTVPIPIAGIDLGYHDLLNRNTGANAYSKADFDVDHGLVPNPMGLMSGAAGYFSSANTFNTIHRDYIADANGYPFSQVEYMRDGTGRVARQGGVGPDHQLNSGHEAKFFYVNSSQTELHRMFGGNVGNAWHYLKKMSLDPNGQVSYAWQDQEERVVATALAGLAPGNLLPLDDMPTGQVTDELPDGVPSTTGNVLNTLNWGFPNDVEHKKYDFDWSLVGVVDKILCDICYNCKYFLDVEVRDPDGAPVQLFVTGAAAPTYHIHQEVSAQNSECLTLSSTGTLEFYLWAEEIGGYQVSKTLSVAPPDPDDLRQLIESRLGTQPCHFPTRHDFEAAESLAVDYSDCDEQPCSTTVYTYNDSKHTHKTDSMTIPCNPVFTMTPADIEQNQCEGIYQAMVADISPGGWMYDANVWSTIGHDPVLIKNYLIANHREYCHYEACIDDAPSTLWDLQMAASPNYTFAEAHHYIPPTSTPTDLWDPWFDNGGPGNSLRGDMVDVLWAAYPPQSPNHGLLEYYTHNSFSAPTVINNTYNTQCSNPACEDELHWQLTVGAYLAAKNAMVVDFTINNRGCPYYNDAQTIVHQPSMPVQATANTGTFGSAIMASSCNAACAGNVDVWMGQLQTACSTMSAQQVIDLENALMNFCLRTCQDGNPQALVTDTYVNAGELQDAINALPSGCSLSGITVTDPYTYDDGNGNVYEGPCVVWDPGMIAMMDEVSGHWPHPVNNTLPIVSNAILQYEYPGSSSLKFNSQVLQLQGSSPCTAMELVDGNGTQIDMGDVKMLRYPELDANAPGGSLLDYQGIKVEAVMQMASAPFESTMVAYMYSDNGCTGGFSATAGTCAYPQVTSTSPAFSLPSYPTDPVEACSTQLLQQALYNADQQYEQQMQGLVAQAVAEAQALCRQHPPLDEEFTMTYDFQVYQYTLYYYDQAGSLIQTVPPEGVELLDEATAHKWDHGIGNRTTDMPPHRMRTTYAFNSLGQMRKSHTPDGGDKKILYTSKDQVRMSQDARQAVHGDWAYVKYDNLGRTVESGLLVQPNISIAAAALDDPSFPDRSVFTLRDITTTHYDLPYDPTFAADNLRTRVAAATREDAEGDYVTTQVYDYDDHGNVKKTRTYLVGFGNFELEYQYDLISGKVNRANYQKGKPDYFAHRYSYDADNRLVKAETTRDNVFWDRDGRYFYYPHGPLARLEIGEDNVQGQDHYYSIHGWIKGVNMPEYKAALLDPGKDGDISSGTNQDSWVARDAFAYSLGFYDGDYSGIGVGSGGSLGTLDGAWGALSGHILGLPGQGIGLYNGNIAMMVTDLKNWNNVAGAGFIGEGIANAYQYDQLNRIKKMRSHHYTVAAGWTRTAGGSGPGYWDSDYSYDRNGNIESLDRLIPEWQTTIWGTKPMDQLTYDYANGTLPKQHNKLDHVTDAAPSGNATTDLETQSAGNYAYDPIGNLINDPSEYISAIDWDLHNKVRAVHRATNPNNLAELKFWYDGTGNRVHKQSIVPGSAGGPDVMRDEWYVRDPQGNEMAVYEQVREDGFLITRLKEHPIYGADRLGMDLNGVEISRYVIDDDPKDPTGDPAGRHALVIAEIMYDSPTTGDDFPTGKEYNEGEYVVLVNKSGIDLNLADYKLHYGADSMALHDTLPAGERVIVAFGENTGTFGRIVALPAGLEDAVWMQNTLVLPDRGGIVSVSHASGAEIDAMVYGDFYGLSAENAYIADTLLDSMSRRSSLKSVQRASYGGASERGGSVGDSDPGLQTERSEQAEVGAFYLNRGRKVYELKNHLGNVLAVVSDVKLGVSTSSSVDYYIADVVEMTDYEPFGMQLAGRHWVSGSGYRFGFNGKESDDEWNGEGNMYNYGFRIHDPRLGRFLSVDPLAPDFPELTTFQYASNTPISAIDLDGLESVIIFEMVDANGVDQMPKLAQAHINLMNKSEIYARITRYWRFTSREEMIIKTEAGGDPSICVSYNRGYSSSKKNLYDGEFTNSIVFNSDSRIFKNDRLLQSALAEEVFHSAQKIYYGVSLRANKTDDGESKPSLTNNANMLLLETEARVFRAFIGEVDESEIDLKNFQNNPQVKKYFEKLRNGQVPSAKMEEDFRVCVTTLSRAVSDIYTNIPAEERKAYKLSGGKTPFFDAIVKEMSNENDAKSQK